MERQCQCISRRNVKIVYRTEAMHWASFTTAKFLFITSIPVSHMLSSFCIVLNRLNHLGFHIQQTGLCCWVERYRILSYNVLWIRIRIRNLYCPYFTEKHQGTRKYINKDIWIPTHYKQTKTLSENTKQWYKIIEYNVERKWQWNDLYTLWHIPQAIAAIIHPEDTEPDEGATAVKRYNRIDYELISHSYGAVVHYVPSR